MIETIDHIDKYLVTYDENTNNIFLDNLKSIARGITYLADSIKNEEVNILTTLIGRSSFGMATKYNQFYPNLFNWFAISTVNYCRTVKFIQLFESNKWTFDDIKINKELIKKEEDIYVQKVIPEVYLWRNKIAAHSAATDPRKTDDAVTLEYSLNPPVVWRNKHFCVGTLNLIRDQEESKVPEWSIVEVFENKLIPRYWPDMCIKP